VCRGCSDGTAAVLQLRTEQLESSEGDDQDGEDDDQRGDDDDDDPAEDTDSGDDVDTST